MNDVDAVRDQLDLFRSDFARLRSEIGQVVVGQEEIVEGALVALIAGGHVLLEGVPGLGKTLLVRTLADTLRSRYSRIQFTPDLMPADLIGTNVLLESGDGQRHFQFQRGPIFANVVLADEINRATPKTQSALLEAMQEHSVTVAGTTHPLEGLFFVMATQNPLDLVGTFPLPDSQLDRFLLSFSLGFPDPVAERRLLTSEDRALLLDRTTNLLSPEDVKALQADCEGVHVSESLLDYIQALLAETRDERWFESGLSPRAGLALLRASRAHAFLENRDFATPEDVKTIFPGLARHRLSPSSGFSQSPEEQVHELLDQVPIP